MNENAAQTAPAQELNTVQWPLFHHATEAWKQTVDKNNGMLDNVILAENFDIPLSDLINLVREMESYNRRILEEEGNTDEMAHCIRGFIGTEAYNGGPDRKMDLFLTGVKTNGEPIFIYDGESAIYDFILACPPTCVK